MTRAAALVGWALAGVAAAAWLALVEVFWLPLRVAGLLVPVSVLAAVMGNLLLVEYVFRRSGSRSVALLPAVMWGVVALTATVRRPEGDLLLVGNGGLGAVGLAFLLCGLGAASVAVARVLARPVRPVAGRAGSDSGGAR